MGAILLASGNSFDLLSPETSTFTIEDIAHGLSMICRFAGQCSRFYCPTPDQKVLTDDLRWVPAGDLKVGDQLLGFDENPVEPGSAGVLRRRYRPSTVMTALPVRRRIFRLEMEDGSTVRCSAEHPWLIATKASRNQVWMPTEDIAQALSQGRARYMHRFFDTWSSPDTRDAGWLAGIYDGEGHLSTRRKGVQLGVSQLPGSVIDNIERLLVEYGFGDNRRSQNSASRVMSIQMTGGWRRIAAFLGTIRPERLIGKFTDAFREGLFDKQMEGKGDPLLIIRAWEEGEEWVAGLETSSRTYFCEGFGAHNSVAQHSVLASLYVAPEHAYAALMHDAAEALIGDVSKPLKKLLPDYCALEERVEAAVFSRFGVPYPLPVEIKDIDLQMLATEQHQLMPDRAGRSYAGGKRPLDVTLRPMGPEEAKAAFLARYHELRLSKGSWERDDSIGRYVADEHGTPITGLSWCAAQPHEKKTSHCPACGVGPLEACRGRVPQDDEAKS